MPAGDRAGPSVHAVCSALSLTVVCFFKDEPCVDPAFVSAKSYPGGFLRQAQKRDVDVRCFQG